MDRLTAERLDAADELAPFRAQFALPEDLIYLDGNSLGAQPTRVRQRVEQVMTEWRERLVGGWADWIDLPRRAGDAIADVIGARPGEVVACDSVTVNLYKLVKALLDAGADGTVLATDSGNFPTDRYVLEGLGLATRFFGADPVAGPTAGDVEAALGGDDVAVLVLSHVNYLSGAVADLAGITAVARERGVPVVWDLSHSAGSVPVELEGARADYAVGCTYKYLNAGPGAPAFLYVREEHQERLRSPIWGWFGQREQFAMERPYEPEHGIARFLAGTPPIVSLAAVEEGARLVAEAGIGALRAKSLAQTDLLLALHDAWLAPLGFSLGSPRDGRRGSHVAIRHEQAWPVNRALIDHARVIPDFRGPDSIRLAVTPLYTRFVDVHDALDRLRDLVERGVHEQQVDATPARVT